MLNRNSLLSIVVIVLVLVVAGAMSMTAAPQKATPKPQDRLALGLDEVKQLLLLIDTDKNGKISKQEYMAFMSAEFDRLDVNEDGQLDPKELTRSSLRVSHFSSSGK
jgi:hypothetical protein